jgi:hypothetical protein
MEALRPYFSQSHSLHRAFLRHVAWVALCLSVFAPQTTRPTTDFRQHYRFFSVLSATKLDEKLNEAAIAGYRLLEVQATAGGSILALMEDISDSKQRFEYLVLGAEWSHGLFSEKERLLDVLNDRGQRGFRLVERSVLRLNVDPALAVLEHEANTAAKYEFRIISAPIFDVKYRKTMRDMAQSAHQGFRPVCVAFVHSGRSHVLMEKGTALANAGVAASEPFRLLVVQASDMSHRYKLQTDAGFRVLEVYQAQTSHSLFYVLLLEKNLDNQPTRLVSNRTEFALEDGDLQQIETVEQELNRAATEGYRMSGVPAFTKSSEGTFHFHQYSNFNALLQQSTPTVKVTYRIAHGSTLPEFSRNVNEAAQEGFRVVCGTLHDGSLVLMEMTRETPVSARAAAQEKGKP